MSIIQQDFGTLGGGTQKYYSLLVPQGSNETVNLDFEVKTIIFADSNASIGYSGAWSLDFNTTNKESYYLYCKNPRNDIGNAQVGSTNARIQSVSSDGKTVVLHGGDSVGGTTFVLYGDD